MTMDPDSREALVQEGRQIARSHPVTAARSIKLAREHPDVDWRQAQAEGARVGLRETGRCENCGRELTDPVSVSRSIGPDCWAEGARPSEPEEPTVESAMVEVANAGEGLAAMRKAAEDAGIKIAVTRPGSSGTWGGPTRRGR